jgi:hypothetical protein
MEGGLPVALDEVGDQEKMSLVMDSCLLPLLYKSLKR